MNDLPHRSQPNTRGDICVIVAAAGSPENVGRCLESVKAHTDPSTPVLQIAADVGELNRVLAEVAPADVIVLDEPCGVTEGWLERLSDAARADTNTATASALADVGTELAICPGATADGPLEELAGRLAERTLRLRPRLRRAFGPCVYVRRDAIELAGSLDEELELRVALEIDFAQRCLLSGLAHVAADDVVVQQLAASRAEHARPPAVLLERYPYLTASGEPGESAVLASVLEAVRGPGRRLSVTLDARALDWAVTGTQVHIVELIVALAQTDALDLRLLVREREIDPATLARLRTLPRTELLAEDSVDDATGKTTVYHRPQQSFAPEDVELAIRLGHRVVLSQLDLIAYRNPGYFADGAAWEDYRRASRHGLSAAERVVVFSDHTRRELVSDAIVEDARIRVVPPGLNHRAGAEPRRPTALDAGANALEGGFLLCLGTDFRHKNRLFAMRLLAALRERHGWQGSLVLAGTHVPNGSSLELEREYLESHGELRSRVVVLGSVGEQEKAWLIANASAVAYPSVYEGFGLVPFESALQGVPCLFAPQSSLAEAAPDRTATIVQWDPADSADAAYTLLTNAEERDRHVRALAGAARGLTWAATAAAMVEVYREAAAAPAREAATLSRDAVARERRLTAAHMAVVRRLTEEREHAQRMYDDLNAEVGSGLSLIGPRGSLPDNLQRALLTLSANPRLSRPLYGALGQLFAASRAIGRSLRGVRRRPR